MKTATIAITIIPEVPYNWFNVLEWDKMLKKETPSGLYLDSSSGELYHVLRGFSITYIGKEF